MKIEDYLEGNLQYDKENQVILCVKPDNSSNLVAEIRGWGNIKDLFIKDGKFDNFAAIEFQDSIGNFVCEAIKEKLQKEKKENTFSWVRKKGSYEQI